jgi:predicted RNase H-like HicB family nuclease
VERSCLYGRRKTDYFDFVMIVPISKVQLRQDEDGVWIAKSSALPGCHAHGRDRGEATLRFQQAAKAHLEALLETGRPIPSAFRDKFVLAA